MISRVLARLGGVAIAAILVLSAAQGASAATFVGGTNVWTMLGVPAFSTTTSPPLATIEYSSSLNVNVTGVVVLAVRNTVGQMVYYTTGSVTVPGLGINEAGLVVAGLPPGNYSATFFAIGFSGVPLTVTSTVGIKIP